MPSQSLRAEDVLVEYRDKDLKRQGSIPMSDLSLKMQPVFNGVGSWRIKLPAEHRAVPYLRAPGSGIVITNLRTGETLMSGPTSRPSKKATASDPKGTVTISGLTDDRLLWDARAFPSPEFADPSDAKVANDVRSGQASTLLMAYVSANIGPGSPDGRRGASLRNKITMGPNPSLGVVTTRRPRYDVLGELLYGIAIEAGLGFRLVQIDEELQFQVYKPTDRSDTIRLDVHNGTLDSQSVEVAPPEVTRMIVAGQGVGKERQMASVTTPESLEAEDLWGLIIEEFKDQRQTDQEEELDSAGLERLLEAGFTKIAVKAVPSNDQTMIFMTDFFLGDEVAVVIDGQEEPNSIITEAVVLIDEDGVRTGVAIGDIADFDSASALRSTVDDTVRRVEHLERNVEIPPQMTGSGKQVSNWDDAMDAGFYWSVGATNSPPVSPDGWWMGAVHRNSINNRVMQTLHEAKGSTFVNGYCRYWNGSSWGEWQMQGAGPFRGTTAERNLVIPGYLDEWYDETDQKVYLGSKSGTWRQKEGTITAPSRAWDTTDSSLAGRTDSLTLPTIIEPNEDILIWARSVGSGFGIVSQSAVTRNPNNTIVSVRLMQIMSLTTQPFSLGWRIEPVAA